MDPETEPNEQPAGTPAPASAPLAAEPSILTPAGDARHALVQAALLEHPWAIRRATLALMARAGAVPTRAERPDTKGLAGSMLDRIGGYVSGGAAVIPVYGVISPRYSFWSWLFGGTSLDVLRAAITEQLAPDSPVNAVILDIDSPGGDVSGMTEIAAWLRSARGGDKPIVAVANTMAASAAYWLASAVDEIVVTPSGEVGSIGVFAVHEDDSALLEMAGIKITLISAGEFKTEGNPYEPLSDDARAAIQADIDTFYGMFVADVAKGRSISTTAVASSYGQGRTLLAKSALAAGMVDRIDTLEATVNRYQRGGSARRTGGRGSEVLTAGIGERTDALEAAAAAVGAEIATTETHEPVAIAAGPVSKPDRDWNARIAKRRRSR